MRKLDRGLDLKTRLGSATIPHTKYILCIFRKRIGAFSHYKRLKCTSLLSSPYLFQWKSKVVDRLNPSLPSYLYIYCAYCFSFIYCYLLFVFIELILVLKIADILLAGREAVTINTCIVCCMVVVKYSQ